MKRALSLLGSLAAALALLVVLELALRALGIGDPDPAASKLKYQQVFLPVLEPAVRTDGLEVLHTTDPRLPYQQVPRPKPPGTFRIVLFGGSAMAGLGFSPNVTIARYLEEMLAEAYPERSFEVVNLGIVALPAKKVRVLVEDVLAHADPDLVVVYSGNNEFLELHAEKYARVDAGGLAGIRRALGDTNLLRTIRPERSHGSADTAVGTRDLAQNDARVSEARMIEEVDVSPAEIEAIHDAYAGELRTIARAAQGAGVDAILMAVAANWEWHGMEDLPEDWADELVGAASGDIAGDGARDAAYWNAALARVEEELAAPDAERYAWLHRRALVHTALGDTAAAAADHRASMNADPHLRRATDPMARRVLEVAEAEGVTGLDTIEFLRARSERESVGFEFFYDYVHFTPLGATEAARGVLETMVAMGIVEEPATPPYPRWQRMLCPPIPDFIEVRLWTGSSHSYTTHDRDLWKYDAALDELDRLIEEKPDLWTAYAFRGNAAFFRPDGAADAERDWMRALELGGTASVLEANLELLRSQHRPPTE